MADPRSFGALVSPRQKPRARAIGCYTATACFVESMRDVVRVLLVKKEDGHAQL